MPRKVLRYGHKITLFAPSSGGYIASTNSALAPLGVRQESKDTPYAFENAIFMLAPGEGDYDPSSTRALGDEVKFGHVVRLIHNTQRWPVVHNANAHAVLDKTSQRISIEKTRRSNSSGYTSLYRTERWRFLPRYKSRGEGERVCEGDHIILQSTLGAQLFLNVSTLRDDRTDGCFEVQCAREATGLELRMYDSESTASSAAIRGGHCITLFHREENRMLRVITSQRSSAAAESHKGRLLCLDAPEVASVDPLSTHCFNHEHLFIIEFEDRSRAGVVQASSTEYYRLRSVSSGLYVSVDLKTLQVRLTDSLDDDGTLLSMQSATDDRDEVLKSGGRIFLCSARTPESRWLTVGSPLPDEATSHSQPSLLSLATAPALSASDAIEVQRLPFNEYRDLSRVLSLMPPLVLFCDAAVVGEIDFTLVAQVVANVRQLKVICFRESSDETLLVDASNEADRAVDVEGQKRLLHQGIPQLLVRVISSILDSEKYYDKSLLSSTEDVSTLPGRGHINGCAMSDVLVHYSDLLELINLCLSVVQFTVRDNSVAALKLKTILPRLIAFCSDLPAAVSCVGEFLKGNNELLEELTEDGFADLFKFLDLFEARCREPDLMILLSLFAANRDEGFPVAQKIIADRIIRNAENRRKLLLRFHRDSSGYVCVEVPAAYLTDAQRKNLVVVETESVGEARFLSRLIELESLSFKARHEGRPSIVPVVAAQLSLLAALCAGRDAVDLKEFEDVISVDMLSESLSDESLPPQLHAGLITLFSTGAVITVGCRNLIDALRSMRYVVDDPSAPTPFVFEYPTDDPTLGQAVSFCTTFLINGNGEMKSDDGRREELDAVVRLTNALLSRGCIPVTSYVPIVHALVAFLDQRNDSATNDPEVFRDKCFIINVINSFFDVVCAMRAARVATAFARKSEDVAGVRYCQLLDPRPDSDLSDTFYDPAKCAAAAESTTQLLSQRETDQGSFDKEQALEHTPFLLTYIMEVLQDIACVSNWQLRRAAIQLFCRVANQWGSVHEAMTRIQLATKSSSALFNAVNRSAKTFSEFLITKKGAAKAASSVDDLIVLLRDTSTHANILPILDHLQVTETLVAILESFNDISRKSSENGRAELSCSGLRLVKALAECTQQQKDLVISRIDSITAHATFSPQEFCELCLALFADPQNAYKLTEECVTSLVELIGKEGEVGEAALDVVANILAVKDAGNRYVSRNQAMVWRAFLSTQSVDRHVHVSGVWTGRRAISNRSRLLETSKTDAVAAWRVKFHLKIMDTIFVAVKQNDMIKAEEVRYELFGSGAVDDLMEVVSNTQLPPSYRGTYVNLLQALVVEDNAGLPTLFGHRQLVDFLNVCVADIAHTTKCVEGVTAVGAEEKLFLGELVSMAVLPCTRHLLNKYSGLAGRIHPKTRTRIATAINDVVKATVDLIASVYRGSDPNAADALFGVEALPRKKVCDFVKEASEQDFVLDKQSCKDALDMAEFVVRSARGKRKEVHREVRTISDEWIAFTANFIANLKKADATYVAAAGAILRNTTIKYPYAGTQFVKVLVESVPYLQVTVVPLVLQIIRQLVRLDRGHEEDCSCLLGIATQSEFDSRILSFSLSMEERQSLVACFDQAEPSRQILPIICDMFESSSAALREAALSCAITLLDGGHRDMQVILYRSVAERGDEKVFVVLRDSFAKAREMLLTYIKVVTKRADPRDTLALLPRTESLLRYTQLLCEGHYRDLQEYLRTQPLNIVSVNVIQSLCELLEIVAKVVDRRTIKLVNQLLATICETVQGPCRSNQDCFVSSGIPEILVRLITLSDDSKDSVTCNLSSIEPDDLRVMRVRSVDCLLALIEGRAEKGHLTSLIASISLVKLADAMDKCAAEYQHAHGALDSDEWSCSPEHIMKTLRRYLLPSEHTDEISDNLALAVNVFIFVRSFLDHQNLLQKQDGLGSFEFTDDSNMTIKRVLRRCQSFRIVMQKVGMVEIMREGRLERTYFRIMDCSRKNLLKKSQSMVIDRVDRSSDNKRLLGFIEMSQSLIAEMDFYNTLRHTPIVSFLQDIDVVLDYFALMWSVLINLVMLAVIQADPNPYDDGVPASYRSSLEGLGIALVIMKAVLMTNFLVGPARVLFFAKLQTQRSDRIREAVEESRSNLSVEQPKVESAEEESYFDSAVNVSAAVVHVVTNTEFLQRLLYFVSPILALSQSLVWYTILLLHITSKSDLLYNVLLAVTTNGISLILTLVLMVVVIYIFATVAYFHFSEFFTNPAGKGYDCQTLAGCWYTHVDAIRAGGGIGDMTASPTFTLASRTGESFAVFQLLFFVIVTVIFLNIVFGIIVDSFAQLREARESIETDQESKCFICGTEQNEFDRVAVGGFDEHVRSEHNMWHYLFFVHYLFKKNPEEFNGQEAHVYECLKENDISFFPIGKSMALQDVDCASPSEQNDSSEATAVIDESRWTRMEERLQQMNASLQEVLGKSTKTKAR